MPKPARAAGLDVFRVTVTAFGGPDIVEIAAHYFQYENGFVSFKEDGGQVVHAVSQGLVQQIERVRANVAVCPVADVPLVIDALGAYDARDSTTAEHTEALIQDLTDRYADTMADYALAGSKDGSTSH